MATPGASAAAPSAAEVPAATVIPAATAVAASSVVGAAPAAPSEPQAALETGGSGAGAAEAGKENAGASTAGSDATDAPLPVSTAVTGDSASSATPVTAAAAAAAALPDTTATDPAVTATAPAPAPAPPQAPQQPTPSPPQSSSTSVIGTVPSSAATSDGSARAAITTSTVTPPASQTVSSASTTTAAAAPTIAPATTFKPVVVSPPPGVKEPSPSPSPSPPPVLVPRCSTWFDLSKINPIEKRMLPEFFVNEQKYRAFPPGATGSSSKTPQLYVKYRNYMVTAYRQQPSVFLTATACRRSLAGDACAILRVHEFLTHWGIINFDVPPHAMPPALNANYALRTVRAPSSRDADAQPVAMLVDSSSSHGASSGASAQTAARFRCVLCARECMGDGDFFELSAEAKRRATSMSGSNNGSGGDVPSNTSSSTGGIAGGVASNGKMAPGSDGVLTIGAFAVRPGSGICEECFITNAYPDSLDAGDFTRVTRELATAWTQEELDRLLDAVSSSTSSAIGRNSSADGRHAGVRNSEMNCDWNYVAAKVGTKTPEQCLLHFLELPLLNGAIGGNGARFPPSATSSLRPMTPAGALNAPVLDLSELVSRVDPLVAKAAARAAVAAVKQLHTMPVPESERAAVKHESEANQGSNTAEPQDESAASVTVDSAAQAIVSSGVTAGVAVKTEPVAMEADGDVVMTDSTPDAAEKQKETEATPIRVAKETVAVLEEAASATTVGLVATRAHHIAEETARGPMRELIDQLLENQLQQMELKMKQLGILEATLAAERDQLARERHELYMDRLAFAQEKLHAKQAASGGVAQL